MRAKVILIIAILLPMIPITEWVISGIRDFQAAEGALPWSFTFLYFPARVLALLGFVLMFYQFLLSAKLPILVSLFKQPNLVKRHRSLGKVSLTMLLVHGLLMLSTDLIDFGRILFTPGKLLGITALYFLIIAVIAALWMKPLEFNLKTWKKIHLAAYLAFPIGFLHAIHIGSVAGTWSATRVTFILYLGVYVYLLFQKIKTEREKKPKQTTTDTQQTATP